MPAYTTVVTHATGDVFPATDWNTYLRDNLAFLHDRGADLTIVANALGTPTNQFHHCTTGATTLNTIPAPGGTGQGGNRISLLFTTAGVVIGSAGNILPEGLAGVTLVANSLVDFLWDDALTKWVCCIPVTPGMTLAYGTKTSNVSTTATTFAGGVDVLASALSFTADGVSDYVVELAATMANDGNIAYLDLNLDGAQAGHVSQWNTWNIPNGNPLTVATILLAPAAGAHTVNLRLYSGSASYTATIYGGAGGATNNAPILVRVRRA